MMHCSQDDDIKKLADTSQVNLDEKDDTKHYYSLSNCDTQCDQSKVITSSNLNEDLQKKQRLEQISSVISLLPTSSKHSILFNDLEYWNRSIISTNMNFFLNEDSKSNSIAPKNSHSLSPSLSESLENAYYSRKCNLKNDFQSNGSGNDDDDDSESNKIDNTITTTYLIWDFNTNSFVEDKSKSESSDLLPSRPDDSDTDKPKSLGTSSSTAVSLASPTSSSSFSNLITTTRFLHSNHNSPNLTTQPIIPTTVNYNSVTSNTNNKANKPTELSNISLTPSVVNSRSRNNSLSSNSSTSVVSKLKSWIGGTSSSSSSNSNEITKKHNQELINTNNFVKQTTFNPPLSIDLTRKLKRPNNAPSVLEYSNGKIFQGSMLEDWLMQTLDDYISSSLNHQSLITLVNPVEITKSEHSLNIFEATPPTSVRTSVLIETNDEEENDSDLANGAKLQTASSRTSTKNKLNSESYKAAIQGSQTNMFGFESPSISIPTNDLQFYHNVNNTTSYIGGKRQEANFYVQQILTDLIALGVLEYESGFENAINKTFKSKSDYVWGKHFALDDQQHIISGLKSEHLEQMESLKRDHEADVESLKKELCDTKDTLKKKIEIINKEMETYEAEIKQLKNELVEYKKKFHDLNESAKINKIAQENKITPSIQTFQTSNIPPPPPLNCFVPPPPPPPPPPPSLLSPISNDLFASTAPPSPPAPPPLSLFQSRSGAPPPPPPPISGLFGQGQTPPIVPPISGFSSGPPPPPPGPAPTFGFVPPPASPIGEFNTASTGVPPPTPPSINGFAPPPPPPINGFGGPPPPPPQMNGFGPPPPLPFGGFAAPSLPVSRPIVRKGFKPSQEMKNLYWNRIQIFNKSDAIWFDVNEPDIEDDFVNLFAKGASKTIVKPAKQASTSTKQELVKLIDSKRSQAIGILMSSKHLDAQLVRDTMIGFDNQLLNHETLNAIYIIRPNEEEIRVIQDYLKSTPGSNEELLDKPELFILELSRIPAFEERIYCLVYQNKFHESISSIEFRLNNINMMCELITSEKIKKILGIVLACGNNMNATNKARCDADGFDLAILPNLKDVKSKDNTTNLLQYIAYYYVNKIDDDLTKFPLPDPSDISFVAQTSFDELEKELKRVKNELQDIERRVENVLKQSQQDESLNEPFKSKINEFLKNAIDECKEQEENYTKCKLKFSKITGSYCMKPKGADSEVTLNYFFTIWATFIFDLKEAWKRESQKLNKQRLKIINEKRNQLKNQNIETKKVETHKNSMKVLFTNKRNQKEKNQA